ncbi:hypothetical protein MKEN_00299600 [Mycena kentingensis (nom. inval.)]|nr:hypothetical protein MKEN_00299600 [Mycena kentingensis (nom. inval.)]
MSATNSASGSSSIFRRSSSSTPSTGALVAFVVGATVFVLALVVATFVIVSERRRLREREAELAGASVEANTNANTNANPSTAPNTNTNTNTNANANPFANADKEVKDALANAQRAAAEQMQQVRANPRWRFLGRNSGASARSRLDPIRESPQLPAAAAGVSTPSDAYTDVLMIAASPDPSSMLPVPAPAAFPRSRRADYLNAQLAKLTIPDSHPPSKPEPEAARVPFRRPLPSVPSATPTANRLSSWFVGFGSKNSKRDSSNTSLPSLPPPPAYSSRKRWTGWRAGADSDPPIATEDGRLPESNVYVQTMEPPAVAVARDHYSWSSSKIFAAFHRAPPLPQTDSEAEGPGSDRATKSRAPIQFRYSRLLAQNGRESQGPPYIPRDVLPQW